MNITQVQPNYGGVINLDRPIGALKTQLSKLLMSVDRIGWISGATSGRFDVRRIPRMLTGSERVFKSRHEVEAVTTAVSIVVDLSSSMHGPRTEAAAQTAWAMADAIERVGCKVQVVGFSGGFGNASYNPKHMRDMSGQCGKSGGMASYRAGSCQVLKGFEHSLRSRRPVFEWLSFLVSGYTPDYHIVRTAVDQLANVPAQRKLCVVITDGVGDCERMLELGNNSEALLGVPVVGIGIQTTDRDMRQSYKYFACIKDVGDLADGALRCVIKQLDKKSGAPQL